MQAWWSSLSGIQQVLWGVAVFATTFFAIQTVLTLIGALDIGEEGGGEGVDIDLDSGDQAFDLVQWFSVRNIIAFLLGISWIGLGALSWGQSTSLALALGILAGVGAVVLNIRILEGLSKLRSSGNIQLENAVGHEGKVSIAIPERLTGSGKVSIAIQQRLMELEAVTEGGGIARGQTVKVIRISGEKLVVSTDL